MRRTFSGAPWSGRIGRRVGQGGQRGHRDPHGLGDIAAMFEEELDGCCCAQRSHRLRCVDIDLIT